MKTKNHLAMIIFRGHLARDLLLSEVRGRWVRPGSIPQPLIAAKTRRKLLKTDRLLLFQFGAKMPYFRQAMDWRKWETLWVIRGTVPGRALRHGDCTTSI